jgi:hypothetical protein
MDKRTELLIKAQNELTAIKEELRKAKLDYKVLEARNHATEIDRDYWKEKHNLLQHGAMVYTEDNEGYINEAVVVPNDFLSTFIQDVPKEIGTIAYNRNRFYKVVNGVVEIDKDKYKKYIGGIM